MEIQTAAAAVSTRDPRSDPNLCSCIYFLEIPEMLQAQQRKRLNATMRKLDAKENVE